MDPSGRVFEDFEPPHSMVREPATHTLTVDLSGAGYKKEHIRVQMVHSHRRLVVRGERPVAGNRWSRFRLEIRVPDGCNAKAIHARFEGGVVRVTMPGAAPEPVALDAPAAAARKDDGPAPSPPAPAAATAPESELKRDEAAAVAQKQQQEARQRAGSAKDYGGPDDAAAAGGDDDGQGGELAAAAASPSRQGYAFLQDRRKMATTVLGVVLVLFSFGIYIRYSLWP